MAKPMTEALEPGGEGRGGTTAEAASARPRRKAEISLWTCTAIVVANMVGQGVYTSIGFQVPGLPSGFPIMFLWALGGIAAFCGAMAYAELAAAIPRSGGEYHFLARIYHPALGTAAGAVSATVGFSAPIALAAFAFGEYASQVLGVDVRLAALSIVFLVTTAHLITVKVGSAFQNVFTALKLLLIAALIISGLFFAKHQDISLLPVAGDKALVWSSAFAISLAYVNYAYSGWNAATYIMDEVKDPQKNVTRALLIGTALVTVLYVLINAVFLLVAPIEELAKAGPRGAYVAATHMFGDQGARVIATFICLGLVSTISAMTWAGPRVLQVMGEDLPVLRPLGKRTQQGIPARAIFFQLGIVVLLISTGTFQSVIIYTECLLMLCASLTVLGAIILRIREPHLPRPFKCWGFPITPILFIVVDVWALIFIGLNHPRETLLGLLTLLVGLGLYYVGRLPALEKRFGKPDPR
jgi:APA family basic amino acid/polyamine antiporter